MRQGIVRLHRWIGIVLLIYMAMICLTGSVLVYRPELFRYFEPQPVTVPVGARLLSDAELRTRARIAFPDENPGEVWRRSVPNQAVEVDLLGPNGELRGYLFDPYTGRAIGAAMPLDFWIVTKLLALHTELLGGEDGRLVNGALGLGVMFLALTGVLVWRPQKKARPSASTGRRPGAPRRLHMTAGIWAAAFVFMWGLTGLHLAYPEIMTALVDYIEPFDEMNPVERTGDKVSYWLAYLHFGRFGGRIPGCERGLCGETLKAVWALIALAPVFLAVSGAVLWLRGLRARERVKRLSREG